MRHSHRLAAALLVLTFAAASARPAWAAGRGPAPSGGAPSASALLAALWGQARCLLTGKAFCLPGVGVWGVAPAAKWGCTVDPNGRCVDAATGDDTLVLGCPQGLDGECVAPAPGANWLDRGCTVDPDGRCLP